MHYILTRLCTLLERVCWITHPWVNLEIRITGRHCNLTMLSYKINEKYNLGVWTCSDDSP